MELTFGGCLQDSHVGGLEVTITVMGVYSPSDKGKQAVCERKPLILQIKANKLCVRENLSYYHVVMKSQYQKKGLPHKSLPISGEVLPEEKKCDGKGSNIPY